MACAVAGLAVPAPILDFGIFQRVLVPLGAVCLSGLLAYSRSQDAAADHILVLGDRLQMRRIDASPVRAKLIQCACLWIMARMVKVHSDGYGSNQNLIGKAVSLSGFVGESYNPVALCGDAAGPEPAAGFRIYRDSREDSLFSGKIEFAHVTLQWLRWLDRVGASNASRSFLYYTPQNTRVAA